MQTRFIRIERAVYVDKVVQPVGAIIEVPSHLAAELIHARKASVAEPPAPVTEEAVAAPVQAPKSKGKKHAG